MMKFLSRLVDSNEREVRRLEPMVAEINALEPAYAALSDDELMAKTAELRARLRDKVGELLIPMELRAPHRNGDTPDADEGSVDVAALEALDEDSELTARDPAALAERRKEQRTRELRLINEALDELLPDAFAAVREAMNRALGKRHYDVQMLGAMVLHRGQIAEMKTGEGKTFVAPLAAYLNGLTGRGVHVVTVNDYLAKRDAQWIGLVFHRLGMSVGSIQHDAAYVFDPTFPASDERLQDLRPVPRQEAYAADVTYGTNNEFGFDYLRDNLVIDLGERVQRGHFFAIVDEVDNILIDEARTPLIISGVAQESADKYVQFARLVPRLRPEEDYILDEKFKQVAITEAGTDKMERWLGVENMFEDDFSLARHLEQALKAEALYKLDRDYVIKDADDLLGPDADRPATHLHRLREREGPEEPDRDRNARDERDRRVVGRRRVVEEQQQADHEADQTRDRQRAVRDDVGVHDEQRGSEQDEHDAGPARRQHREAEQGRDEADAAECAGEHDAGMEDLERDPGDARKEEQRQQVGIDQRVQQAREEAHVLRHDRVADGVQRQVPWCRRAAVDRTAFDENVLN